MVQNLIRASQYIRPELSQIYEFFGILTDCIGLNKAVLMVLQKDAMVMRPWAQVGFDETSLIHLQVDSAALGFLPTDGSIILDHPANLPVGSFFSTKDHENMEAVLLLPVISHGTPVGLLIVADNPYFSCTAIELDMIFRPIQDLLRQVVEQHQVLVSCETVIRIDTLNGAINLDDCADTCILIKSRDVASLVCEEYGTAIHGAALQDIQGRVINTLQRQIERVFVSENSLILVIVPAVANQIDILLDMALAELVRSLGMQSLENSVRACFGLETLSELWKKASS